MSAVDTASPTSSSRRLAVAGDLAFTALLAYGFFLAVGLTAEGLSRFDEPTLDGLRAALARPVFALSLGVLATLVLQSSSVTTALAVALAAATSLPAEHAVPLVLGANVGATVASSLVGLGQARQSREFQRAFACASLHDLYNVLAVLLLLPLELATGLLSSLARTVAGALAPEAAAVGGGWTAPGVGVVRDALHQVGADGFLLALLMLVIGGGLMHQVVHAMGRSMGRVLRERTAAALDRTVAGDRRGALGFGLVAALAVHSAAVTTSLLVPLVSAGVLGLGAAFPVMIGANVGTTLTAVLAAAALVGPQACAVAVTHVAFNLVAALLYALPPVRALPLAGASGLARLAARNGSWVFVGLLVLFVVLPVAGMLALH